MMSSERIQSSSVEYRISPAEINRRKGAFSSLMLSILVGLIVSSIDFLVSHVLLSCILVLVIAGLLFGAAVLNIRWQNNFARKRFIVNQQGISRISGDSMETWLFRDIRKINIKRTTKGNIRQIKISLSSGRSSVFNGLAPGDFDRFRTSLAEHCLSAEIFEIREPVDFDHRLFYPVLGLVLSSLFTVFIRLIVGLNDAGLKIVYICIVAYVALVGLFIFLMRPYYNLNGPRGRTNDITVGIAFLILAVLLYFYLVF
jgi:hypothetical protein